MHFCQNFKIIGITNSTVPVPSNSVVDSGCSWSLVQELAAADPDYDPNEEYRRTKLKCWFAFQGNEVEGEDWQKQDAYERAAKKE